MAERGTALGGACRAGQERPGGGSEPGPAEGAVHLQARVALLALLAGAWLSIVFPQSPQPRGAQLPAEPHNVLLSDRSRERIRTRSWVPKMV